MTVTDQVVRAAIEEHGLLPVHDARVLSVCTLVAGEPVRGTWWAHPRGHDIFDLLGRLEHDHAWPKLLWGKVTLVHRRLWAALAAVGEERAPWQLDGLGDEARAVLDRVRAEPEVRTDALGRGAGKLVTALERRLLLVAEQVHTDEGHHVRRLRAWSAWLQDVPRPTPGDARAALEQAASSLGARRGLPW